MRSSPVRSRPSALAGCARRWSSSLPPHKLVPMPRLSPTMTTGTVSRWRVDKGDPVKMYDLMYEVTTRELLEEGTPDDVVMEVEGHEDGFIAKILAPVGTAAAPDQPIAVLCEERDDVAAFKDYTPPEGTLVPTGQFIWQAYLKKGLGANEGGK